MTSAVALPVERRVANKKQVLHLYREPHPQGVYVYGADPAKGGGGDFSSLVVLDAAPEVPEEVACLHSNRKGYEVVASAMWALHQLYPVCRGSRRSLHSGGLGPEVNNDALRVLLEERFPLDYWYIQESAPTPRSQEPRPTQYGFYTLTPRKDSIINYLRATLEAGGILLHSPYLAWEAPYWDRDQNGHWEFGGRRDQRLGHGDYTMALAIALAVARSVREWIQRLAVAAMGPKQAPKVYYDWSKWQ